ESFSVHVRRRRMTALVADNAMAGGRMRAALGRFARDQRIHLQYAGLAERTRFARALPNHAGGSTDLVEFALLDVHGLGYAPGINRNAILLASAGEAVAMVDDDMLDRLAPPPGKGERERELCLSAFGVDREAWFFSSKSEWDESCPPAPVD